MKKTLLISEKRLECVLLYKFVILLEDLDEKTNEKSFSVIKSRK